MHSSDLKSSFTKRYIIAITIIAFLSCGAFYFLYIGLKLSDSTALIVNMSGKQRMLSQRIASLSQQYYASQYTTLSKRDPLAIRQSLLAAIDEMGNANEALSSGALREGVRVDLSVAIKDIYYGESNLKHNVENYLNHAKHLTQLSSPEESLKVLRQIVDISNPLLADLNRAVLLYQQEGEKNITNVQYLESMVLVVTLFTLLLEVIFIFQPMANKLHELFQELEWNRENLEQKVEMRTLNLERVNAQLRQIASHDPLTGLKNRLNMEHDLEELIAQYDKHSLPFAVLMLDIDWFKKINDTYGHDAGDFILCEISKIMVDNVRVQDSIYRAGGEEFVIIFNRITRDQAFEKAEQIRVEIEKHRFVFSEDTMRCTISGGLYHPDIIKASHVQGVLKLADNGLYAAKRSGRNRILKARFETFTSLEPQFIAKTRIKFDPSSSKPVEFIDHDITQMIGYDYEELSAGDITLEQLIHPEDYDVLENLHTFSNSSTTLRMITKEGKIKIVRAEISPAPKEGWNIDLQDALRLFQGVEDKTLIENFQAMMVNTDDFIYFKDRNHVFTAASETLVSITSATTKEDFIGKTDYELFSREYADKYFILEKEVFNGTLNVAQEIQPILDNNGHHGWVDNRKYPIKNSEGEIIGLFGIARILSVNIKN
jgi:two-component system, cell cycle response regulator